MRELQGTFNITSGKITFSPTTFISLIACPGELLWGQLASILSGLMTSAHDFPSSDDRAVAGGTILTQGYTYRAPAKPGVWNVRLPPFHFRLPV